MTSVTPQYLRVRNWEKFQHYKDRRPLWIKSYVEILDDYDIINLPPATQLVYFKVLLVAARLENKLPNDPKYVASLMHLDTRTVSTAFTILVDKRFLEVWTDQNASDLLADPVPRDREETEKERTETPPVENVGSLFDANALDTDRHTAYQHLLARVTGGDRNTPKVIRAFCKKLPKDRIERVAAGFDRRCVSPGVAVQALKAEIAAYETEVLAS